MSHDVSQFATSGNIVAGIKFCFPGSENVSKQIQKHFCCRNNKKIIFTMQTYKELIAETIFPSLPAFSNVSSTTSIDLPISVHKTASLQQTKRQDG